MNILIYICAKIGQFSELLDDFCIFKLKIEENENMAFSKKLHLFDSQLFNASKQNMKYMKQCCRHDICGRKTDREIRAFSRKFKLDL